MTLQEIGNILHRCPGLAESMVAEYQHSESQRGVRNSGGFESKIVRYETFRVRLSTGIKLADVEKPDLGDALYAAFDKIDLPMPDALEAAFPAF